MIRPLRRALDVLRSERLPVLLALIVAFLGVTLFRLEIIATFPYPSSSDVGGDLYSAQQWLGNPIPGLWIALQPPLYYWLIVIPFTAALGPFAGPQTYMAVVPALLVFPGYFLIRKTPASIPGSILGATLLATSTSLSLMVTWNGAYNALGIVFLVGFLGALMVTFERPTNRRLLVAGVLFGLVAATHLFTFLLAAFVLVIGVALWVGLSRHRRAEIRTGAKVVLFSAIACLPMAPILYESLTGSAGVGVGGYAGAISYAFSLAPFFTWGFQSTTVTGLFLLDTLLAGLGIASLWWRPGSRAAAVVVSSVLIATILLPFVQASNADRALYFLTIPAVVGIPSFCEELGGRLATRLARRSRSRIRLSRRTVWNLGGGGNARFYAALGVSTAALASLLLVNASVSSATLDSATAYYSELTPNIVQTLDWLGENTPANSRIYDSLGIAPWIWGVSHRLAYEPQPLSSQVTNASYQATLQANYISLGEHLAGAGALAVSSSAPSQLGVPSVFVAVPGYWAQFVSSQADLTFLIFSRGSTTLNDSLASASTVSSTSLVLTTGAAEVLTAYDWPGSGLAAQQEVLVTSRSINISWTSNSSRLDQVQWWLGLNPQPSYYSPTLLTPEDNVSSYTNSYQGGGATFSTVFHAGNLNQMPQSNGWTYLWCRNSTWLNLTFAGPSIVATPSPWAMDTSTLIESLGITYALADPYVDYYFFGRVSSSAVTGADVSQVFQSGNVSVFQFAWT
jgi:hypothetical protein